MLATVATLVLGGASVAGALTAPPLDAHTDLEFSLDGANWTDAPDLVLGAWGCDVFGGPVVSDPTGAIGGTPRVEPCSMSPGESIDRTYHVRNASESGRTGRYAVGVGDFLVSGEAEFAVSSAIAGPADADSQTVTLYGADTPQAADTPARGSTVAALDLGPGQSARVVDEVSVPLDVQNYAQRQSVSPMIWVSFSEIGGGGHPPGPGGGSADLPDFIWPIVVVGIIGAIVTILGPALGSLGGSVSGLHGGSIGPGGSSGSGAVPGAPTTSTTRPPSHPSSPPRPGNPGDLDGAATGGGRGGHTDAGAGQVTANAVSPRDGAPSSEWTRANSQVRGSLAETGVDAEELVLWALTAAAAGVTLLLLASHRRDRDPES